MVLHDAVQCKGKTNHDCEFESSGTELTVAGSFME